MKWEKPYLIQLSNKNYAVGTCAPGTSAFPGGGCSAGGNPVSCLKGNQATGDACSKGGKVATACGNGTNG